MSLPSETAQAAEARLAKYRPLFEAQALALDTLYDVFETHRDVIKVRKGRQKNLSVVVVSGVLGKGAKTCSAVRYLCYLGYGEDAGILVRANLSLLINLSYIVRDTDPLQRLDEYFAHSYLEREKLFRLGYKMKMPIVPPVPQDQLQAYAKAWKDLSIEMRAEKAGLKDFHYAKAYRYFSSPEHSDAFALNTLLSEWNEVGPVIRGEDDQGLSLALFCNYLTACDLTLAMMHYYRIEDSTIAAKLRARMHELEEWDAREDKEEGRQS